MATRTEGLTKEERAKGYTGILHELNDSGDTRIMWNRDNEAEVSVARNAYASLKEKGYAAFSVRGERGEKGDVIRDFDPNAERIIMSPAPRGG